MRRGFKRGSFSSFVIWSYIHFRFAPQRYETTGEIEQIEQENWQSLWDLV